MQTEQLEGFRLSPQQKHLWLSQQSENILPLRVQCAVTVEGNLNFEVLKTALQNIVNQYEILRTSFNCFPGMTVPLQVIADTSEIYINEFNFIDLPSAEQENKIESLFTELTKRPFKLENDIPFHVYVITLSPTKYILMLNLSALIADSFTLKGLVEKISSSYAACSEDKYILDEPMQYADIAEWQNELLKSKESELGKEYWRKQDVSSLDHFKLWFEKKQSITSQFQPQHFSLNINNALIKEIELLANTYKVNKSDFLLVCWLILFWKITRQSDIAIGITTDGRKYEELEQALGPLSKCLPLSYHLEAELKFSEILKEVNKLVNNAYELQEYFTWQETINSESFCPVGFEFEEEPETYSAGNLLFSMYKQYSCTDKFKIKLSCLQRNDTLIAQFYFDPQLYNLQDIQTLSEQFQNLLASAINNRESSIGRLNILDDRQRQQLLIEFNNTQKQYPQNKCIHEIFEEQVEQTPDKLAVVFEGQQVTYYELNARANQLANYLQSQGVKPETLVGLYLDRSHLSIIGLLGILKAGAAYLPIDSALPTEGLAFRLQDAGVSILLTQRSLIAKIPASISEIICLDTDWETIEAENQNNLQDRVQPNNLAYAIYTSGSTGKPKAVAIQHRQLVNYVYSIVERLDILADANFATVSTFAADLGNTMLFPALCTGGCLHIIDQEIASDPQAFSKYCQHHPIDYLKIVPSHLSALLSSSPETEFLPRKKLILGGEASNWQLIAKIQQQKPDSQIFNHYGPTETTVGVLTYPIKSETKDKSNTVPIGKPLANNQVYILDEQLQPVPIGVPGELYIAGMQVSRGYLNRPELNNQKFIPNPFKDQQSIDNNQTLYKTGDLVKYLPDGNIEFLGRIDRQVKIRGFRIELGEIESILEQHSAVQQAVVIFQEDNQRLVSYITAKSNFSPPNSAELRDFLAAKLPEYALPNIFVSLKEFPLTANGKIDRKQLPAPETISPELSATFVAPQTATEKAIAEIWSEILGVERVGIQDNFFQLGGHSLLVTQVVSRIRQAWQTELSLRQFFDAPTVAGLAAVITQNLAAQQETNLLPSIQPQSRDTDTWTLSFAQERLWFLNQLEPNNAFYNQPRALRLTGELNLKVLKQTFQEIIRRHESLRTNFTIIDGKAVQIVQPQVNFKIPVEDLTSLSPEAQEEQIYQLAEQEAEKPFNLEQDLLLRITLLKLGASEYVILFTTHHIISDRWSIGILIQELVSLYQAFSQGQPTPLAELPIQYVDFATWQRQWLLGEVLEKQKTYWLKQLENAPKVLELPTDHPRPAVQTFRGANYSFELSKELSATLNKLSQQQGSTLFMTLLAGFQTLLWRYTAQDDIVVGSPIANRNRAEIEGLIGFFLNTLMLRTSLAGNPSFEELLQRVRETALGAYAHQDFPFELLVEQLQPERDLSHTPLFQVMFVLQNAPMSELELPGLTLTTVASESKTAKFDLTLSMTETESGLEGSFEYNTDLFERATIARMAGHLQILLEAAVANPQQKLSDLPLLTEPERQQLLVEWNETKVDYPQDKCIHEIFEAQVDQTPDAVAVVFENQQLTYWELNARANQLAHHLQQLKVKPEVKVGICVERSVEMVIGLLAILKAGGAYVPLDPNYPQERIEFMLEDTGVSLLLTQQRLVELLPEHKARVLCLDQDWNKIADASQENLISGVTLDNLAYVIYTSGSTGKPKGIGLPQRSLVNLLQWHLSSLLSGVRTLQFAPLSFDVSFYEIFATWGSGGTLFLLSENLRVDAVGLGRFLWERAIEKIILPVVVLHLLAESVGEPDIAPLHIGLFNTLREITTTGEQLQITQPIIKLFKSLEHCSLHNHYGPSETHVVTASSLGKNPDEWSFYPPIGQPIANTQIHIVDRQFNVVPLGVTGELYIGGVSLAQGYLNRPDLTAEKFIPNPFSKEPGARLYKTGDLARYLPNGNIEYVGRIDHQVKVRGFRIELREIEVVISQHKAIKEVVVIDKKDEAGNKRLVAYVVSDQESTSIGGELRSLLNEKLPSYMVPSAFVFLEKLPLTSNGKVDRRALPVPDLTRPELLRTFVAPRTTTEEAVAEIWKQVLGIEKIGIHDNFFELGGHSLLVTQLVAKLLKSFEAEVSVVDLFEASTVAALAERIEKMQTLERISAPAKMNEEREEIEI